MTVLKNDAKTATPVTFTQDRNGNVLWANGLERPQRWQIGMTSSEDAGITKPASAPSGAGNSAGSGIQGIYKIAVQYLDDEGVGSDFSDLGTVEVTTRAHSQIDYTSIPKPTDIRVTRKVLWRTTDGQTITYYQDTETATTSATVATGTKTDAQLIASTAMRYVTAAGFPNALRFGVPPSHMAVVAHWKNRTWWGVPGEFSEGTATSIATETTINGSNTQWEGLAGSYFYMGNEQALIDSVVNATTMVLASAFVASGTGTYKIIPGSTEWDSVYFSEDGEPESVPASNKIATYADGDRMSGLMPLYGEMFLLKQTHIYRLTTCSDPRLDTQISLVAERGCVNQRCWTRTEGMAFLMDRNGAYIFNGNSTQAVSGPVQNYWRDTINWSASKWFSVVHDKKRESVMFIVALDSDSKPQHALVFSYRLQQWHLEDYNGSNVGAACEALIDSKPRVVAGVDTVSCLMDQGTTDEGAAIAYDVRFGRWRLPETENDQERGVGVRYEPTSAAHSAYVSHYYDGSGTAVVAQHPWKDNQGVAVAAGASAATLDMTQSAGYLRRPIDGSGFEGGMEANRSMEIEISGSVSEAVTILEIDVDGAVG